MIIIFAVPANHKVRLKEGEKRNKNLDLARVAETMEHEGDGNTSCNWCTWNELQRTGKRTEDRNERTSRPSKLNFC